MSLSSFNIARWASNMRQSLNLKGGSSLDDGDNTKTAALSASSVPEHKASDEKLVAAVAQGTKSFNGAFIPSSEAPKDETEADMTVQTDDSALDLSTSEMMALEKQKYPGASDWAQHEERLFEILFLRQVLPMLPSHWNIDFRGFPLPVNIFDTSKDHPAIVYAHNKNGATEFAATAALTKLIDLTLAVRTMTESATVQSALDNRILLRKTSELIRDRIQQFVAWSARDGGYDRLRYIPNIVVEIVEAPGRQDDIVNWMRMRMRALARLQRDFLTVNRDARFWDSAEAWSPKSSSKARRAFMKKTPKAKAGAKRKAEGQPMTPDLCRDELATLSPETQPSSPSPLGRLGASAKKRRLFRAPTTEVDELSLSEYGRRPRMNTYTVDMNDDDEEGENATTEVTDLLQTRLSPAPVALAEAPRTPPPKPRYRRPPPVVYGVYILGTSVFVLTMDSTKGDNGYVSFQVDIDFADQHQSVWNALTLAIVVCSARDELMGRLSDFEALNTDEDSDPDA